MKSALEMIGNTPLVELSRLHAGPGRIFAKAEFVQPGGSVKDRAALQILKEAYAASRLQQGQPVIEMTSGNMGAGLAVVCNIMGNPFIAVMSEGNSPERARMLRGLGAELVLVPQVDGAPGQVTGADIDAALQVAQELACSRGAFYVDQFNNGGSVRAHEQTTGPELWAELEGNISAFVAGVGTGGTFTGVSRYLKTQNGAVQCIAVEPEGAEVLAGRQLRKPKHLLQGSGYGRVPPLWQPEIVDQYLAVTDAEAEEMRFLLAKKEGLYVGYSSAANVCASIKAARQMGEDAIIATILADTGLKY